MFDFSTTVIDKIVVHHIGNKLKKDGVQLSNRELEFDDDLENKLISYFLKSFKTIEKYQFTNIQENDDEVNEIYRYTKEIFENKD